ncbi:MAG TPA: hypothetical protein VFH95_08090 [Candidatus Kapabacteria bacterium]|nr:hypothetical protein [Candidatus Kapabacteria bacterium]
MMSCHEARTLLYDAQTMRTEPDAETGERGSLLAVAKAHVLVCVMCNGFFEQERAFVHALRDRIAHIPQPVPVSVLGNTLQLVQQARLRELQSPSRGFRRRTRAFFRSVFRFRKQ